MPVRVIEAPETGVGDVDRTGLVGWQLGLESSANAYPVVRLVDGTPDWGTPPGPTDEVGHGMHVFRGDDCLAAAVATVTQTPIKGVPDFALDERLAAGDTPDEVSRDVWERLEAWAAKRGRVLEFHDDVPVACDRWIGVVCWQPLGINPAEHGHLSDHCLVMDHDQLVFDPAVSVKRPRGMAAKFFTPDRITYGITLDRKE